MPATGNVFTTVGNCNATSLPGSHPCTAMAIDTGQCLTASNNEFPASGLNPGCARFQGDDVWFTMQVPVSGSLSFETKAGNINDTGLAVWRGNACNTLQHLGCTKQ
jgi:hypothetical protein